MANDEYKIVDAYYGKGGVRLMRVDRQGPVHTITEIEVKTHLTLSSVKDYTQSDNTDIIATDSQKNTVYILAKQYGIPTIEDFALRLSQHFLMKYPQVTKVHIHIDKLPWQRIQKGGRQHNHAFVMNRDAYRYCEVHQNKHGRPTVSAGLLGLQVLKTTQSAFRNFVKDEYRSLPDADDRIVSTVVDAKWVYSNLEGLDYDRVWEIVKTCILDEFGGDPDRGVFSASVQNTLYMAEKAVLNKIPQVSRINMVMPNRHYFAFDLTKFPKFGFKDNTEVFMPVDKPSGTIAASLERNLQSKL